MTLQAKIKESSRSKVKIMTVSPEERFHQRPRYSKEEFAQHGDEIYESQIRLPTVGSANAG